MKLSNIRSILLLIIVPLMLIIILAGALVQIDSGQVGVKLRNGRTVGVLSDGLHFTIPFIERVVKFDARTQKEQVQADSASKDLQQIDATIALNYSISRDKVDVVYRDLGLNYRTTIVEPKLQESVKTVTARFTAEELITRRPEVKEQIITEIRNKLTPDNILVEDVNIVNFGFSKDFTSAIEEKQLAEQRAKKAQNDLERVKIEAQQQVTQAQAAAESQKLQQQTLNDLLLKKQFIEKWDGKMPQVMGSGSNIIDLNTLVK